MPEAEVVESQAAVATEVKPETTTIGKKKTEKTGNLILDIAKEVESMSKQKALNEAAKLAENIEVEYFRLGGVLKLISENSWFEGFEDFGKFVFENFGFQYRKAQYLITIYTNLVTKQIPWDKVSHLGWTKLKDLAPIITPENVDEWAAKAEKCTVLELQALLKASQGPEGEATPAAKVTDEFTKVTLKFKPDQLDTYNQAIAKGKGELKTEFDAVVVENILGGYLGGNSGIAQKFDLDQVIKDTGFEPLLTRVAELFPEYDIEVKLAKTDAATTAEVPATA